MGMASDGALTEAMVVGRYGLLMSKSGEHRAKTFAAVHGRFLMMLSLQTPSVSGHRGQHCLEAVVLRVGI